MMCRVRWVKTLSSWQTFKRSKLLLRSMCLLASYSISPFFPVVSSSRYQRLSENLSLHHKSKLKYAPFFRRIAWNWQLFKKNVNVDCTLCVVKVWLAFVQMWPTIQLFSHYDRLTVVPPLTCTRDLPLPCHLGTLFFFNFLSQTSFSLVLTWTQSDMDPPSSSPCPYSFKFNCSLIPAAHFPVPG